MGYILDDDWDNGLEVTRAGTAAFGLYARCGMWVARHTQDGIVPSEVAASYGTPEWARKLVAAGLWETVDGGYRMPHYHELNPTGEQVRRRRREGSQRQALVRDPALRDAVRSRDADRCRYCGAVVRWQDRRGELGGTYDHVDPDARTTVDNVVVACRSCVTRKGGRSPAAAGMVLRPIPGSAYLDTAQIQPGTDPGSAQPLSPPLQGGGRARAPARGARRRAGPAQAPLLGVVRAERCTVHELELPCRSCAADAKAAN